MTELARTIADLAFDRTNYDFNETRQILVDALAIALNLLGTDTGKSWQTISDETCDLLRQRRGEVLRETLEQLCRELEGEP